MRRVPVGATVVVALAILAMIGLGLWQLQRRAEKEALLARYAANERLPAIAVPARADDTVLFRRARTLCLAPGDWRREAGRAADGSSGWRAIARCGPGSAVPGLAVQMGVGDDPVGHPLWAGGVVEGHLTRAPQHRALIAGLFGAAPPEPMLVADRPLGGLRPNPGASLADVPNNHLAYAVQWFVFAGIAAVIYAVALRRRRHPAAPPPERG